VHSTRQLVDQVTKVLEEYEQPALVEEFLPGREFTVAMLGNGEDLKVLPIVEIKFDSLPNGVNPIYSYEAKWIWDQSSDPLEIFECPANLSPNLKTAIEETCRNTYSALRCRDWSRIDVRLDKNGRPNIIEINPLPGILPKIEDNSCYPKAARMAGLNYQEMLNAVLDAGIKRYSL
jgi:D-alanine-D-alanine ligase